MEQAEELEKIQNLIKIAKGQSLGISYSREQLLNMEFERAKSAGSKEPGVCPLCHGLGLIPQKDDGAIRYAPCKCAAREINQKRMEMSGLADSIERYSFENYYDTEDWQKRIKRSAQRFLQDAGGKWFFIGGQVGSGKTHICTAIVRELMERGKRAQYMLWVNEVAKLKANRINEEEYSRLITPLQTADVLYIDDFFKTGKDREGNITNPTAADLSIAFEILNYRYVNPRYITIISSEKYLDDIMELDEAVGSRIYQMCKGYRNMVSFEEGRNYRMRG